MLGRILFLAIAATCLHGCVMHHVEEFENGQVKADGGLYLGSQVGHWTYYYRNGQKRAEGSYKNDIPDGEWTYYYRNGDREMQGRFENEMRAGPWKYWHSGDVIQAQGRFDQGKKTGQWSFHDMEGALVRRGDFVDDERALVWKFTDEPEARGLYFRGQMVGLWSFEDENGECFKKVYDSAQDLKLVFEEWSSGGRRRVGLLLDNRPEGRWVSFHPNGERRLEGDFQGGSPTGKWMAWDQDGNPYAMGTVTGSQLGGDWVIWEDGELYPLALDGFLPPSPMKGWSGAEIMEERDAEDVIPAWIAELRSGSSKAGGIEGDIGDCESPPPELVEKVEREDDVNVREQPEFTVGERARVDDILAMYTRGAPSGGTPIGPYSVGRIPKRVDSAGYDAPFGVPGGDEEKAAWLRGQSLPITEFIATDGSTVNLAEYQAKGGNKGKRVMLVILRGFAGQVCVYCTVQTKALSQFYPQFNGLDTEVFIVYPGPRKGVDALKRIYTQTLREDFPPSAKVLYDANLELVKKLSIDDNSDSPLARPTTLILNTQGIIEYAYVGQTKADRPPFQEVLEKLQERVRGTELTSR